MEAKNEATRHFQQIISSKERTITRLLKIINEETFTAKELIEAISDSDIAFFSVYLKKFPTVDMQITYEGYTGSLLHWAAKLSNMRFVKFIIKKNPSINATDEDGNTPLHIAARDSEFDDDVSMQLVIAGAEDNLRNKANNTPLLEGIKKGRCLLIFIRPDLEPDVLDEVKKFLMTHNFTPDFYSIMEHLGFQKNVDALLSFTSCVLVARKKQLFSCLSYFIISLHYNQDPCYLRWRQNMNQQEKDYLFDLLLSTDQRFLRGMNDPYDTHFIATCTTESREELFACIREEKEIFSPQEQEIIIKEILYKDLCQHIIKVVKWALELVDTKPNEDKKESLIAAAYSIVPDHIIISLLKNKPFSSSKFHPSWLNRKLTVYKEYTGTPLHFALLTRNNDALNHLFPQKADLTIQDSEGDTPLHLIARTNQLRYLGYINPKYSLALRSIKNKQGKTFWDEYLDSYNDCYNDSGFRYLLPFMAFSLSELRTTIYYLQGTRIMNPHRKIKLYNFISYLKNESKEEFDKLFVPMDLVEAIQTCNDKEVLTLCKKYNLNFQFLNQFIWMKVVQLEYIYELCPLYLNFDFLREQLFKLYYSAQVKELTNEGLASISIAYPKKILHLMQTQRASFFTQYEFLITQIKRCETNIQLLAIIKTALALRKEFPNQTYSAKEDMELLDAALSVPAKEDSLITKIQKLGGLWREAKEDNPVGITGSINGASPP